MKTIRLWQWERIEGLEYTQAPHLFWEGMEWADVPLTKEEEILRQGKSLYHGWNSICFCNGKFVVTERFPSPGREYYFTLFTSARKKILSFSDKIP